MKYSKYEWTGKAEDLPEDMPEGEIKKGIRLHLEMFGYEVQYIFPERNRKQGKGVADMVAMKRGVTTWIEVKDKRGVQSKDQVIFEEKCKRAGVRYILARSREDLKELE